jgi:hypothetical protein
MDEADGQLHTLSVLEQLREASKGLWGASSEAYFRVDELLRQLANPSFRLLRIYFRTAYGLLPHGGKRQIARNAGVGAPDETQIIFMPEAIPATSGFVA